MGLVKHFKRYLSQGRQTVHDKELLLCWSEAIAKISPENSCTPEDVGDKTRFNM
jgi:hypothetical protein